MLRSSPRYPVSLRVAFSDGDGPRVNEATSLSVGGMFVRTDRDLPVGDVLPVAVELPDGDPPAPVQAKVLYSSPIGTVSEVVANPPSAAATKRRAAAGGRGFGVQFVAEDPAFRTRVTRYIDSLLRDPKAPAARLLSIARDLLRDKGWTQLYPRDANGRFCLSGALREAAGNDKDLYRAALRSVGTRLNVPGCEHGGFDCHCAVIGWNDVEGRTRQQVIAKLDEAISAELAATRPVPQR
ncbi:MAG TPA: PilZ domain-containing protein [Myxococcales bacterium]|nr:PilZ domain-containing protein [Myxococcales bacterium]